MHGQRAAVPTHGRIFNIQKFSVHDGPGIRTLVFFAGCPLRCDWCANPEGIDPRPRLMFTHERCTACATCAAVCERGVHVVRALAAAAPHAAATPPAAAPHAAHTLARERCLGCGKCVEACPNDALALPAREYTVDEVLQVMLEDSVFYRTSGGGVTLGGGDPVAQPVFAQALLRACRKHALHTAMETSGHAPREVLRDLVALLDLVLIDIKHMDASLHRTHTGRSNTLILANIAELLRIGAPVAVRIPVIPGFNDTRDNIERTAHFLRTHNAHGSLRYVELLPYHRWGEMKHVRLGLRSEALQVPDVNTEFLHASRKLLAQTGLPVWEDAAPDEPTNVITPPGPAATSAANDPPNIVA